MGATTQSVPQNTVNTLAQDKVKGSGKKKLLDAISKRFCGAK